MPISRRTLKSLLQHQARAAVPEPDTDFVDRLERHLLDGAAIAETNVADNVLRFRRRTPRAISIGIAAATLVGAAAAAVALVGTGDDARRIISASDPTTAEGATTPTAAATTTSTSSDTTTTTAVAIVPPPVTTEVPPNTTSPHDVPGGGDTTIPSEPTTTTEVHVPATMTLTCFFDSSNIKCTWTAGPDGTDHYVVLRSRPGGIDGRVLAPAPGALTISDYEISSGDTFIYLVHAVNSASNSVAHSEPIQLTVP